MKASRLLFLPAAALLALVPLASFRAAADGSKPAARDVRELPAFTRLALSTSVRVVLRQGSPQRVEVDASAADQQWLETVVKGDRMQVSTRKDPDQKKTWHKFEGAITVYVTMPTVAGVSVNGSGTLKADSDLKADKLDVAMNGSGELELPQLRTESTEVSVHGSGDAHVYATRNLKASLVGSGDVFLAGGAQVSSSSLGSGKVHQQ